MDFVANGVTSILRVRENFMLCFLPNLLDVVDPVIKSLQQQLV